MREQSHLYHVLLNEKAETVFAQKEEWGKYSVCMHALMTGEVRSMPGHPNVYYSFWDPSNPVMQLDEGNILFFLQAESLIEAVSKVGPIWWEVSDMKEFRAAAVAKPKQAPLHPRATIPYDSTHTKIAKSNSNTSGVFQTYRAIPPPMKRKAHSR